MGSRAWLAYAMVTTVFWGVWGAFTGLPANHGFPETLIYVVWAFTMFPPALYALRRVGWRVQRDPKSIVLGALIGFLGAGGQTRKGKGQEREGKRNTARRQFHDVQFIES